MEKEKAVLQAVKTLKRSQFGNGVTAIKVELEAQFDRGRGQRCEETRECNECYGDWESASECENCDGMGYERLVDDAWQSCSEGDAGSSECDDCSGYGRSSCEYCDEGQVECDCGGECDDSGWGSELACHDYIMEKMVDLGLAEKREGEYWNSSHGMNTEYHPIGALKYAEFYRDGSVDSEFTFTIMLDNPENIFLLPKVIEIWNQLGEEIDNGMDVRGAGMHMALLSTEDGSYGSYHSMSETQAMKFTNFKSSMQLLLPALYCLGASNETSRRLDYRRPTIDVDSHRAAIDYRHGALEFRIFDTCYDNPENILDNVVVISKCMKYWAKKRVPNGMKKITEQTTFGDSGGDDLNRFYCLIEHVDLLNTGLRKLKPSYYTITEVKQQRKVTVSKRSIGSRVRKYRKQVTSEYAEYLDRWNWSMIQLRHNRIADLIRSRSSTDTMEQIEANANAYVTERGSERQDLERYVEQRLAQLNNIRGEFTLCAE